MGFCDKENNDMQLYFYRIYINNYKKDIGTCNNNMFDFISQ